MNLVCLLAGIGLEKLNLIGDFVTNVRVETRISPSTVAGQPKAFPDQHLTVEMKIQKKDMAINKSGSTGAG